MRSQKGSRTPASPPQTVKKLLEQKRRLQGAPGPRPPAPSAETAPPDIHPIPHPLVLDGGQGGEPPPGPPPASYPPWHLDPTAHNSFLPCHYYSPAPGPPCAPTQPYRTEESGGFETADAYSSMMGGTGDFEVPPPLGPFPVSLAPETPWLPAVGGTPALPPLEPVGPGDLDPEDLASARAKVSTMDLSQLLQQDEEGDTLLHLLAAQGLRAWAWAIAETVKGVGGLEIREHQGKTPLLVAAAAAQAGIVSDLLVLGAEADAADQRGRTVLHLAASYGHPHLLRAVMTSGIQVNVEARNFEGQTPLHCAVVAPGVTPSTRLACITALLCMGADCTSQELKSNKTGLHLAVQEGNISLVDLFLQHPAAPQLINMKAHGHTALHMAAALPASGPRTTLVRLLLARGADPSARNLEHEQPAHLLPPGPAAEQLRLLLKTRRTARRLSPPS